MKQMEAREIRRYKDREEGREGRGSCRAGRLALGTLRRDLKEVVARLWRRGRRDGLGQTKGREGGRQRCHRSRQQTHN